MRSYNGQRCRRTNRTTLSSCSAASVEVISAPASEANSCAYAFGCSEPRVSVLGSWIAFWKRQRRSCNFFKLWNSYLFVAELNFQQESKSNSALVQGGIFTNWLLTVLTVSMNNWNRREVTLKSIFVESKCQTTTVAKRRNSSNNFMSKLSESSRNICDGYIRIPSECEIAKFDDSNSLPIERKVAFRVGSFVYGFWCFNLSLCACISENICSGVFCSN